MKNRLIIFGPSASFGTGLENPEKEVWGRILADNLSRDFINNSIPGASNKLICYKATTFRYLPEDLVIISWAFHDRYTVLKSDVDYRNFMPSDLDTEGETYYKFFHEDFDHLFLSKVFINYTLSYLTKKGIEVYSLFDGKLAIGLLDDKSSLLPIDYAEYNNGYPRASDGIHVGVEGHRDLGNTLYKFFKKSVI